MQMTAQCRCPWLDHPRQRGNPCTSAAPALSHCPGLPQTRPHSCRPTSPASRNTPTHACLIPYREALMPLLPWRATNRQSSNRSRMNNVGCYTISGNMSNIDQIVGVANAHVGRSPPCLRPVSYTHLTLPTIYSV